MCIDISDFQTVLLSAITPGRMFYVSIVALPAVSDPATDIDQMRSRFTDDVAEHTVIQVDCLLGVFLLIAGDSAIRQEE